MLGLVCAFALGLGGVGARARDWLRAPQNEVVVGSPFDHGFGTVILSNDCEEDDSCFRHPLVVPLSGEVVPDIAHVLIANVVHTAKALDKLIELLPSGRNGWVGYDRLSHVGLLFLFCAVHHKVYSSMYILTQLTRFVKNCGP